MKFFIAALLVLLSFIDGNAVPLVSSKTVRDPPPATNVTAMVVWDFSSGINVTVVAVTVNNLKSSQYLAVGLGQNQAMGETHVFVCKRFADDKVAIERFKNPMNHSHPIPAGPDDGGVFTPLPSKFMDGMVTCHFVLSDFAPATMKQPNVLNPLSQSGQYHPIFAVGLLNATGDVQYHDGREAKPELVKLDRNEHLMYTEKNPTSL